MKKIVVLSGAGISAESGISTFRDANGLWEGHKIEEVATLEAFGRNSKRVHNFYNQRRAQLSEVKPNAAHKALARVEESLEYEVHIITQNVDDLHERAGSVNVYHMHGYLFRKTCVWCEHSTEHWEDIEPDMACSNCGQKLGLRPDIVWFGEIPYFLDEIESLLMTADIFASVGTSGAVRPAADFVHAVNRCGGKTIEFNDKETLVTSHFAEVRRGTAGKTVPAWVDELLLE